MARNLIASDRTIRSAGSEKKRISDGSGLYLRIEGGTRYWRQDYTHNCKRNTLSLGTYPEIGLAEARRRSEELRSKVAHGIDPSLERKRAREAKRVLNGESFPEFSFGHVALAWLEIRKKGWGGKYFKTTLSRLRSHVFPTLGHLPIAGIRRSQFANLLIGIDQKGLNDTAGRVHKILKRIGSYAAAIGHLAENPCPEASELLQTPCRRHHAAITEPTELAKFLCDVLDYRGTFVVKCAMELLPMTFLRSESWRSARWSEIDFNLKRWVIPASRMKGTHQDKLNERDFIVPLSNQAIAILKNLKRLTGQGEYVFAGDGKTNPFISENAVNSAIRRMGYSTQKDVTGHGFRATARTLLVERLGWSKDIVELQLGHVVTDANGDAYNRTQFLQARALLMQQWADYLEQLCEGAGSSEPAPLVNPVRQTPQAPREFTDVGYIDRTEGIVLRTEEKFHRRAAPFNPYSIIPIKNR